MWISLISKSAHNFLQQQGISHGISSRITLLFLMNTEYSPFNKSKPKRHPVHCVFKGQPCPGGAAGLISGCGVWCLMKMPQGFPTGLSWALGCRFHGELHREVPACGKDSHKAQEMALLREDATSLSWECQCLFFLFLTRRKKKSPRSSGPAAPSQGMLRGCQGSIISLCGKRKHIPLQQRPGIPPEKAGLSLSAEKSSIVEVAVVLHSLIPAKQIAIWWKKKMCLNSTTSHSPLERVPKLLGVAGSVLHSVLLGETLL